MKNFLFPIFFLFFSCKEKTVIIPDSVLSSDTMVSVLVDIQILEAMIAKNTITDSLSQNKILQQYAAIFKKHTFSQQQFEESYNYYKENTQMLEEIYEKTINELSKMQALIGDINTSKIDSVRKEKEKIPYKFARDAIKMEEERKKAQKDTNPIAIGSKIKSEKQKK